MCLRVWLASFSPVKVSPSALRPRPRTIDEPRFLLSCCTVVFGPLFFVEWSWRASLHKVARTHVSAVTGRVRCLPLLCEASSVSVLCMVAALGPALLRCQKAEVPRPAVPEAAVQCREPVLVLTRTRSSRQASIHLLRLYSTVLMTSRPRGAVTLRRQEYRTAFAGRGGAPACRCSDRTGDGLTVQQLAARSQGRLGTPAARTTETGPLCRESVADPPGQLAVAERRRERGEAGRR